MNIKEIPCETCILLPLCLVESTVHVAAYLPYNHSIYLCRWTNDCDASHTSFLEVKKFFLIQKGIIREDEYGPGRY